MFLVLVMTASSAIGLSRLGFDDLPLNVFKSSESDFQILEGLFDDFGSDDNDCIIVVEGDQIFSAAGASLIGDLSAALQSIDGVQSVRSLADILVTKFDGPPESLLPPTNASEQVFADARSEALDHPLVGGHLLSRDAKTALVIARLEGDSLPIKEIQPTIAQIRTEIDELKVADDSLRVRLTGVPPLRYEIFTSIRRDSVRFMLIGNMLAFLMATILFRRFWPVIAVATPPLLAAVWTIGVLGWLGEKFNVINTILPVLVMIVGFTDSVHLMFDVRHSLSRGLSPLESAKSAIEHLGIACALTSFTTAVGFASLMVTNVEVIRKLGWICGIGAILAFIATIILVPLFASSPVGLRLTPSPHASRFSALAGKFERTLTVWAESMIHWIVTRAGWVTVLGVVIVLMMTCLLPRLEPNNRLTENLPATNESVQALAHLDQSIGGVLPGFVLLEWEEALSLDSPEVIEALSETQQMIEDLDGANHPISVLNLLKTLPGDGDDLSSRVPLLLLAPPEVVDRFVRRDRRRATVAFFLTDDGVRVHEPTFREIERRIVEIESRYDGIRLRLTGTVVVASRNINQMITDLAKSVGLATIVIFITMTIVFRSWKLGLISLLPNAFPLITTAAFLVITNRPLELTSVIVFSICLGIAVDDTIHVINRFQRELSAGYDVRSAIKRTFIAVGSALVTTTVVLIVGFGSVSISEMPPSQLFAKLGMIAIFAALIGDLVILPAMLVFFLGRKEPT